MKRGIQVFDFLAKCFDVLAPRCCVTCEQPLAPAGRSDDPLRQLFCASCFPAAASLPLVVRRYLAGVPLIAPFAYGSPMGEAVRALKFSARQDLAWPLGCVLADALASVGLDGKARLVPVPLHPCRLAERGYNQATLLARAMARALRRRTPPIHLEVEPLLLQRKGQTAQQARLERAARMVNTQGVFSVRHPYGPNGCPLILVDDVVTTGATVEACITPLREVGAKVVAVIAVCEGGTR